MLLLFRKKLKQDPRWRPPQHGPSPGFSTGTRLDLELKGSLLLPRCQRGSLYEHMQKRAMGLPGRCSGRKGRPCHVPRPSVLPSWELAAGMVPPRNTQTLGPEGTAQSQAAPAAHPDQTHGHFTVFSPPPKPKRALWPVSKISELFSLCSNYIISNIPCN